MDDVDGFFRVVVVDRADGAEVCLLDQVILYVVVVFLAVLDGLLPGFLVLDSLNGGVVFDAVLVVSLVDDEQDGHDQRQGLLDLRLLGLVLLCELGVAAVLAADFDEEDVVDVVGNVVGLQVLDLLLDVPLVLQVVHQ